MCEGAHGLKKTNQTNGESSVLKGLNIEAKKMGKK